MKLELVKDILSRVKTSKLNVPTYKGFSVECFDRDELIKILYMYNSIIKSNQRIMEALWKHEI